jgi:hypothetical protein
MTFARNFEVFSLAFYEKAQKKYRLSIAFGAADVPFQKPCGKPVFFIQHLSSLRKRMPLFFMPVNYFLTNSFVPS